MPVEDTTNSRRLLRDRKIDSDFSGGDSHVNAAFAADDSVFVDFFDHQTPDSLTAGEVASEIRRKRGSSTSSVTRKGYNRLDDENESPDDIHSDTGIPPADWPKQTVGDQTTKHQAMEKSHAPPLNQQSPQRLQMEGSNPNSVVHTSHDNMAEPRVDFKLGHKHSPKTDISGLKEAKKLSFQKSNLTKSIDPLPIAKTNQRQTGLALTKQEAQEKSVYFQEVDAIEEAIDATLYFHPTGPPQRNWTAYKSAIYHQPRSVAIMTEREHVLHPSLLTRSQSMRLPRYKPMYAYPTLAPKKPLRQLSFSDSDAENIHDYGSLVGGQSLPRRTLKCHPGDTDALGLKDDSKLPPAAIAILIGLMDELLERGKIREVALLSLSGGAPIASVPVSWNLPPNTATSLVKAVLETTLPLVRVKISEQIYVCLKHGPDRMVGHSDNNDVLVAQKTAHYIVLGLSEEDTPGSCIQEVMELVEILTEKGW